MKSNIKIITSVTAVIWLVFIVDVLLPGITFNSLGILPRTLSGLIGIPLMPFLHGGLIHIVGNTIPFVLLSLLLSLHGPARLIPIWLGITLIGGLLVWLFGRSSYHIGASGLIFGVWGYLLASAYFTRSIKAVLISMPVVLVYGGMFFSLLSVTPGVSFEGHLFGVVAGVLMARWESKPDDRTSQGLQT